MYTVRCIFHCTVYVHSAMKAVRHTIWNTLTKSIDQTPVNKIILISNNNSSTFFLNTTQIYLILIISLKTSDLKVIRKFLKDQYFCCRLYFSEFEKELC